MHLPTSSVRLVAVTAVALVLAAGCASSPDGQAAPPGGASSTGRDGTAGRSPAQQPSGGSPRGDSAADVTVRAAITGDEVEPPPHRVEVDQGQTVRLRISSDSFNKIHVHGYDIEKQVTPSQPAVITFTADQVGLFEVEAHHPALQVVQLQVR